MVDVNFKTLFPTPFGHIDFGESHKSLNEKLISDIEDNMSKSDGKNRTFKKNDCGWQSESDLENEYESFKTLGTEILKWAKPIMSKSGISQNEINNLSLNSMWANVIFKAGGFSNPHIHGYGNTLWTGVYYPKGIEGTDNFIFDGVVKGSGILVLKDPAFVSKRLIKCSYSDATCYGRNMSIVPKESLLVLFPVWVEHYVTPTIDDERRYSISFGIHRGY